MFTFICFTVLAYLILGKDIEEQLEKLSSVKWEDKAARLQQKIKVWANRAGRVAAKPILQFYYVLTDSETSTADKAMLYAAILYTVLPVSALPRRVFKLLGVLDEGAALIYVYRKVNEKITPEINAKVEKSIHEWFGYEYAYIVEEKTNKKMSN